ncbi:bifunctional serine/threonine-protein kinase/formylglycine-generating enzyme family protein [Runella sp. MFBS21]|uniref:bifunctional serine/threonine-protein kinase/formylglycine-generating enzyme family protein n=1 Tax=Runella sp. MFBS21 TaxID=3034018 RepID=UPI0023F67C5A|nr:bifunctional serine/threonine-protein kinase/formylglycine-generating enzyme family protein [Runella sp. MFBS21]MDF7821812.1 bifunctional serine/threonine-protein kinase/formylglycine-generating enzyme family protein [Runella sp. MFBS21]
MNYQDFLDRFEYDPDADRLGEGGFGVVYKAHDQWRYETVALKIVRFRPEQEHFSLLREFELAQKLKHLNIAHYSECYQLLFPRQGMHEVAVMKYYEDGHLGQLLTKKTLSVVQKHRLIEGLMAGIGYLHRCLPVIIHRDLKPSNVLIIAQNNTYIPLITDFGISRQAKASDISHVTSTTIVGSLHFAAPEQAEKGALRPTADLWSLGILMSYIWLDGCLPFRNEGLNLQTDSGQLEYRRRILTLDWAPIVEQIPEKYFALIRQCLVVDPHQRAKSVDELVLPSLLASELPPVATPVESRNKPPYSFKNNPAERKKQPINPPRLISEETGDLAESYESSPKPISSLVEQTGIMPNPLDMVALGVVPFQKAEKEERTEPPPKKKTARKTDYRWLTRIGAIIGVLGLIGMMAWYMKDLLAYPEDEPQKTVPYSFIVPDPLPSKTDTAHTDPTEKPAISPVIVVPIVPQPAPKKEVWEKPILIPVAGGRFDIGGGQRAGNEKTIRVASVQNFWIAPAEVTVKEYRRYCRLTGHTMPQTPPWGWKDNDPVVNVTWQQANDYCLWVSKQTGDTYRLPTEVEWEYAARGGKQTKDYLYAGSNELNEVGWYNVNTQEKGVKPVRQKKANELGLYDMSGNAGEWCAEGAIRGGTWNDDSVYLRPAVKRNTAVGYQNYETGFRIVKTD